MNWFLYKIAKAGISDMEIQNANVLLQNRKCANTCTVKVVMFLK